MISRISKRIAIKLYRNDHEDLGSLEIYTYGLEIIISSLVNMLLIIILSVCTGLTKEMILFIIFFGILRISAGGYHAPSHLSCFLQYAVISFGAIIIAKRIMYFGDVTFLILISCLLSIILVYCLAPVDSNNKRLNAEEIHFFKQRSRYTILIQTFILLLFLYLNKALDYYVLICSWGTLGESISLLPILNKKGEIYDEKV